jgi:periplasmic divalent cation tolerance protein
MSELNTKASLDTVPNLVPNIVQDTLQDALVVITTTETQQAAEQMAHQLVKARLAACVQLIAPVTSVYRWQGKVETASEVLLLIKTTRAAYAALERAIKQTHSYQTPEIIALPIATGAPDYLTWLRAAVKPNQ